MRKIAYLCAIAATVISCGGNKGYVINGTIEGAEDGDMVYLQKVEERRLVKVDSAQIAQGKFTFKGIQDSVVSRYITCTPTNQESIMTDFFLENGNINAKLSAEENKVIGTSNNNTYQKIKEQIKGFDKQINEVYGSLSDTTLTAEAKQAKINEIESLQEQIFSITKDGINANIDNPVGIYLLKTNYYYLTVEDLAPLMPKISEKYAADPVIIQIKENVSKMQATAVGQKFTDFEMLTPEGNPIKLSDYVGKGKVVLVDFWASWCGPCRREMPTLVEAYAKYKNKNFEIVGVSLDQSQEAWVESTQKLNITWPQMSDLKYWNSEGAKLYAVSSIPHTVLIDGEGIIIARGLHGEGLKKRLAELLE